MLSGRNFRTTSLLTKKKRKRDEEVDGVASKRVRTTRHFVHLDPIPHAERPEFPYDLTAHIIPPPAPPRNELTSENVFELKERHLGPYTITGSRDGLQSWDEEKNDGTYLERDLGYAPSSGYRGRRTVLDEDELIAAARADPEHPFPNGVPRCYADQARKPMDAKMNDWLTNYTYPKATPEQMVGALLPPAYPNWSFVYDYELNYEIVRAPTPRKKYF
ncbi:hypothetical protein BT69DRAFT_716327 [Atractiella rhizophila]|nr:hypothetical protein BT69DRAFT_716327 [Atractiella rhizophila]